MTTMDKYYYKTNKKLIDSISLREGSPCLDCLVRVTCTRSILSKSACLDYVKFLQELVERAKNENKT